MLDPASAMLDPVDIAVSSAQLDPEEESVARPRRRNKNKAKKEKEEEDDETIVMLRYLQQAYGAEVDE